MTQMRRCGPWPVALIWLSASCLVLSMPCVFFGVLGLLGVVADVSLDENRQFGRQFLRLAMFPMGLGAVGLVVALALRRSRAS
jgi:hypothetical protein